MEPRAIDADNGSERLTPGRGDGRGGPPSGGAAVRSADDGNDEGHLAVLELPPEVWAGIMEYLPFDAVLACGAVSRSMLHEALPRLTRLRIDNSAQMNLKVASRFRDVTEIHINSLFSSREVDDDPHAPDWISIDFDSRIRAVPFLSRFGKLERVHFGGKDEDGNDVEGFSPADLYFSEDTGEGYPHEPECEIMLALIDQLSGAFHCGALPEHLKISGLCCPNCSGSSLNGECGTCMRACKSFPLESVCRFENRQSSVHSARSGRQYGLDVCLDRAHIESVIESRPGGHDLLSSEARLLYLLSRGRLYTIAVPGDTRTFRIVKYNHEQLMEIKRVIKYAELDVKKLSMHRLSDAVVRSFTKDEGEPIPAKNDRYLSDVSLDFLRDKLGLHLDDGYFRSLPCELVHHARRIASVAIRYCNLSDGDDPRDCRDIVGDCLGLIRQFSELDDPPLHDLAESIPSLVKCLDYLEHNCVDRSEDAAAILRAFYANGEDVHRRMAAQAGVVKELGLMMCYTSQDSMLKAATLALADVVAYGTNGDIEALQKAPLSSHVLIGLLLEDEVYVESSLKVMAAFEKDRFKTWVINQTPRAYHHLVHVVMKPDATDSVLANSVALLRIVIEVYSESSTLPSPGQDFVRRLVKLKTTAADATVQENLSHILIDVAAGTIGNTMSVLVREDGLLSTLVDQVDSIESDASKKALSVLKDIADESLEHCKLVSEAGVAKKLVQMHKSDDVQTDVAHLLIRLAAGTDGQTRSCLVREEGFLSALVGLADSSDSDHSEKAVSALGNIADSSLEHCNLVLDAGIAKPLLRMLKSSSSALGYWNNSISLKIATKAFATCSRADGFDPDTTTACLKILPALLANSDKEIVANSCWALHNILDGFSVNHLSEVTTTGLVRHLLKPLSRGLPDAMEPALKSVCIITSAGGKCIQSFADTGGIPCIRDALLKSDNGIRKLASSAMSNIVLTGNKEQIQAIVDVMPSLVRTISSNRNKRQRFLIVELIYKATKVSTAAQIEYLASQHCIEHVCNVINADYGTAVVALRSLENILKAGKDDGRACPDGVQMIESKLAGLVNETQQLDQEVQRIDLLKKKKVWLEYDAESDRIKSLNSGLELLKTQQLQAQRLLRSFEKKVASTDSKKPADKGLLVLRDKWLDIATCLETQVCNTTNELRRARMKLSGLHEKAEKAAPTKEWQERLAGKDLPEGLQNVSKALEHSSLVVNALAATRTSHQREVEIESIKSELGRLFNVENSASTKKRSASDESGDDAPAPKKQRGA